MEWQKQRCMSRPATKRGQSPRSFTFDSEELTAGHAKRSEAEAGTPLSVTGVPQSPMVRIVDPDTHDECPEATTAKSGAPEATSLAIGRSPKSLSRHSRSACRSVGGTPEGPW